MRVKWYKDPFMIINTFFLTSISILCILPLIHIISVSLSDSAPASKFIVGLWPVDFTTEAYNIVLQKKDFISSLFVSFKRIILGVSTNMILTIMMAYPLSKETDRFPSRNIYIWVIVFTMLFNGGLIPTYMVVQKLGLINSIWSLVLPMAVPVFNVILMINFMRQLPKELIEAAIVDGASEWNIMTRIVIPLSLPVIATVTLFSAVMHWNSWFDGLIYMSDSANYPLQTYLHGVISSRNIIDINQQNLMAMVSDRTILSAQIVLGALPILCVYPFLQRYFMHGIVMGSVKE